MIFWNVSMIWHQFFSVNSMWALQHMALLHLMVRCSGKNCPCVDDLAIAASWFSIAMWNSQRGSFVFSGDGGVILPGQPGAEWIYFGGPKVSWEGWPLDINPRAEHRNLGWNFHGISGTTMAISMDFSRFFNENRGCPWDFHRFYPPFGESPTSFQGPSTWSVSVRPVAAVFVQVKYDPEVGVVVFDQATGHGFFDLGQSGWDGCWFYHT